MKLTLALALLTASFAFAGEIEHTIRSVTNGIRVVDWETYTRNGSTNLLRETDIRKGLVGARVHRIYCGGQLAAGILWMTNGYTVLVETGLSVRVNTFFKTDGELDSVMLGTEDGHVVDLFTATNGVLYPAQNSEIKEANECSQLAFGFVSTLTSLTNTPAKK
ncbi:MAG: hypothetical protein ABSG14_00715 [Verrucomicrobiia bacterium]